MKKIKGTHVFQPSNGSQGAAFNNIRQSQPTTTENPSDPLALSPTLSNHHSLGEVPPGLQIRARSYRIEQHLEHVNNFIAISPEIRPTGGPLHAQ